jgi:DNA-binding Lrp family transcriptional regulator
VITQLGKKSTRGQIIEVLTEEFPLTAKKIYNKMKASGSGVTYHAVYDRISELIKEGVLKKVELQYMINPKWISKMNNNLSNMIIKYSHMSDDKLYRGIQNLSSASVVTFHSFKEQIDYIKKYKYNILNENEGQKITICWMADHLLAAIVNLGDRPLFYETTKQKNLEHFTLVKGNTSLDKAILNFNKKFGITKMKIGVKGTLDINVGVYNDTVFLFMHPQDLIKDVEKFFKATKTIDKMNIKQLNKILNKKTSIHVIIIKEHDLSEYFTHYIKAFFKK